jgi:hypothetical protein
MENYKCQCGKIFDTPEEYHTHLKEEIAQYNEETKNSVPRIVQEYYEEIGQ